MDNRAIIALVLCFFFGCKETPTESITPPVQKDTGAIYIESTPSNADILLMGNRIGSYTPYTISALSTGDYEITLKKPDYYDTLITVSVVNGKRTSKQVALTSKIEPEPYFKIVWDWQYLYLEFNYPVYLSEVTVIMPTYDSETYSISKDVDIGSGIEIDSYYKMPGTWKIKAKGSMKSDPNHSFNKTKTITID